MMEGVYSNSFSLSFSLFYVRIKLNVNDFDGDSSLSRCCSKCSYTAIVHMTQFFFCFRRTLEMKFKLKVLLNCEGASPIT